MINDRDGKKRANKCVENSLIDVATHLINQFQIEPNRDSIIATGNQIKFDA